MEYTNNKIFNIRYNKYKNVLELKRKNRLKKAILSNKIISISILLLTIAIGINIHLVSKFFFVLSNL